MLLRECINTASKVYIDRFRQPISTSKVNRNMADLQGHAEFTAHINKLHLYLLNCHAHSMEEEAKRVWKN